MVYRNQAERCRQVAHEHSVVTPLLTPAGVAESWQGQRQNLAVVESLITGLARKSRGLCPYLPMLPHQAALRQARIASLRHDDAVEYRYIEETARFLELSGDCDVLRARLQVS